MKIRRSLPWAFALVLVLVFASIAFAFGVGNVDGVWEFVEDGGGASCDNWASMTGTTFPYSESIPAIQSSGGYLTDENQVRYGEPSGYDCPDGTADDGTTFRQDFLNQSGFGFNGINGVAGVALDTPFYLGSFTHYNNPISASGLDYLQWVDLEVTVPIDCDDNTTTDATFTMYPRFNLDETPNNANPCKYPDGPNDNGCSDRVLIEQPSNPTFTCPNGAQYTVNIYGFTSNTGCATTFDPNAVSTRYLTREQDSNTACLWAEIDTPIADVGVTKSCTGFSGTDPHYVVTVTNAGPGTALGAKIVDTLPSGVTFLNGTYTSQRTVNGVTTSQGTCTAAGQVLTCNLNAALPETSSDPTAKWVVDFNVDYSGLNAWQNSVTLTTTSTDLNSANNTATATCSPQLTLTAHKFNDYDGSRIQNGVEPGLSGWTMSVYPSSAGGCTGTPLSLGTTDAGGNYVVTSGLTAGSTYWVGETVKSGWTATTLVCQSVVVSPGLNPVVNFGNRQQVDLLLTKVPSTFEALPGTPFYYTMVATNNGPANPATNVVVNDTLPSQIQYFTDGTRPAISISPTAAQRYCVVTGQVIQCNVGDLAMGASVTITFWVKPVDGWDGSDIINDACVAMSPANMIDGVEGNNCDTVTTTPVTLSYFLATPDGDGVRFDWSTATETANVGFNLYVQTDEGLQPINNQLIPSQVLNSTDPQEYTFSSPGLQATNFFIEDVDVKARTRMHGPFTLGEAYGANIKPQPVNWSAIRAEHEAKRAKRAGRSAAAATEPSSTTAAAVAMPASGLSLFVSRDGLYRVTYEALMAAGFNLSSVTAADLALINRGAPVPITVISGKKFSAGSYIEFYGLAVNTLYTRTNVYTLQVNRKVAKRIPVNITVAATGALPVASYLETVTVDANRLYSMYSATGDPWYNRDMLAYRTTNSWNYTLTADQVVPGSPAQLTAVLWGVTDWPLNPDHHAQLAVNGTQVADERFDGQEVRTINAAVPAGALVEGTNILQVTLPGDSGADYDMVAMDRYSVTYPRSFVARDGRLTFTAAGQVFKVSGLTSSTAVVYRYSRDTLALMKGATVSGTSGNYSVTFPGLTTAAQYLVASTGKLLTPDAITQARTPADITTGTAQYLVIAHPDFLDGLAPLVQARQAQGLTVRVVNVNDVYARYSYSIFDAAAIRDYIRHAAANMGAQYVLLVGNDVYDYLNYGGTGAFSFIPTLYARTSDIVGFAPVDPLYTDMDGNGVPDLAIGRFPVRSTAELNALVAKTLAYGTKDYGRTAVFTADKSEAGAPFASYSNTLAFQLPSDWSAGRAHVDDLGMDGARGALVGAVNKGVALTNFFGHSSESYWTYGSLFSVYDAAALTNAGRPSVFVEYGCYNTYHVATGYNTISHELLGGGDRGAVAVLGPTALSEASSEILFGSFLTPRLVEPGKTIGAAIQEAKVRLAQTSPGATDILLGFTLLGDPALVVEP